MPFYRLPGPRQSSVIRNRDPGINIIQILINDKKSAGIKKKLSVVLEIALNIT